MLNSFELGRNDPLSDGTLWFFEKRGKFRWLSELSFWSNTLVSDRFFFGGKTTTTTTKIKKAILLSEESSQIVLKTHYSNVKSKKRKRCESGPLKFLG